jgi:mono/diheme cytochrome c family protein
MRLFKQLIGVFAVLILVIGMLAVFAFDVVKINWVSFMEIQNSFGTQEKPLAVPAQSIPVEGPAYISGNGVPVNPVPADDVSLARGTQIFSINCLMCHGDTGEGTGTVGAFLVKKKPADLTNAAVQAGSDGDMFLSISNGIWKPENTLFPDVKFSGQCPPLNENLSVRERWDVINYVRTLGAEVKP